MRTSAFLQKRSRSPSLDKEKDETGEQTGSELSPSSTTFPAGFIPAALKPEQPDAKVLKATETKLPEGEEWKDEESEDEQVEGDLPFSEKEVEYSVNLICEELKEPSRYLVMLICQSVGNLAAVELMKKAQAQDNTEQGVLTQDSSRRRTAGGIFFKLAKEKLGRIAFNELQREFHKERKRLKLQGQA